MSKPNIVKILSLTNQPISQSLVYFQTISSLFIIDVEQNNKNICISEPSGMPFCFQSEGVV